MSKILVIGSGISGLMTAWALNKYGDHQITIVDKNERAGGLLSTLRLPQGLVETAANGLLANELVDSLLNDIEIDVIRPQKESAKRYVYWEKPKRWPLNLYATFSLLKTVLLWKVSAYVEPQEGESVRTWIIRIANKEVLERLIEPALFGIYACPSSMLSAEWINRRLRCRKSGKGLVSFENGMGELIERLKSYLLNQNVQFKVTEKIDTASFDRTVFATGLNSAALLTKDLKLPISTELLKGETLSLSSVTLFSNKQLLDGFGCLFPLASSTQVRGILQNNNIFRNRVFSKDVFSETWICSGKTALQDLLAERERLFPDAGQVLNSNLSSWERALPLYSPQWCGIMQNTEWITDEYAFCGNYVNGIGLTQILEQAQRIGRSWAV